MLLLSDRVHLRPHARNSLNVRNGWKADIPCPAVDAVLVLNVLPCIALTGWWNDKNAVLYARRVWAT